MSINVNLVNSSTQASSSFSLTSDMLIDKVRTILEFSLIALIS